MWDLIKVYWKAFKKNAKDKYLFDGQTTGEPYTAESVRGFIKMHCKHTGVEYKKVHSFRRYAITWQLEHGVPENVIAEKSGHTTTRTIEKHYAIHSRNYLRSVASPLATA